MAKPLDCPTCGMDISDTYDQADPDVGLMHAGWYCAKCDKWIIDDDDGSDDFNDPGWIK